MNACRRKWTSCAATTFAVVTVTVATVVMAADFGPVRYDPKSDQIVVTVVYDGTNPNHHFSIQWGPCRELIDQLHEPPHKIIAADVIDDQADDAAVKRYTQIVRVPLAGVSCRPATVTLWTQPNFTTGVDIP